MAELITDEDGDGRERVGASPRRDVRERLRDLAQGWAHGEEDINQLLDRAASSLAQEANHELRQILTMVFTRIELASHRTPGAGAELDEATVDELLGAIERGTRVVESHLDRREVAKSLIQLEDGPVDLEALLDRYFEIEPLDAAEGRIHVSTDPVQVQADEEKLYRVVSFLISWLWRSAPDGRQLTVEIEDTGDRARCFVGTDPCPLERAELMERLVERLTIDDLAIDLPYVRAVIERHGGVVFVDQRSPTLRGYGFEIPKTEAEP